MHNRTLLPSFCLLLLLLPVTSLRAQLPGMSKQPWIGFHSGYASKKFDFGLDSTGTLLLMPVNDKKERLAPRLHIIIEPRVMETTNGAPVLRKTVPESITTTDAVSDNLTKVTCSASAIGGATFETTAEIKNDKIHIHTKLVDKGTQKNPTRVVLRVLIPNLYSFEDIPARLTQADLSREDKEIWKKFESKTEDDQIQLTRTDNKREKFNLLYRMEPDDTSLNGPGILQLELAALPYQGRSILIESSADAPMTINPLMPRAGLFRGFNVTCPAPVTEASKNEARLVLSVR